MIRTPTTFVIGAGASYPYGLPLGAELLKQARAIDHGDDLVQLIGRLPTGVDVVQRFMADVKKTPIRSIDDYLAKRQDDVHLMKIGRAVIAGLMGRTIASNRRRLEPSEDWLGQIIEWMSTGAHSRAAFDEGNAAVRFVTFNFDSIIEERLIRDVADLSNPPVAPRRITDIVRTIHVHGRLPDLPMNSRDPFGRTPFGDIVEQSVEWLRERDAWGNQRCRGPRSGSSRSGGAAGTHCGKDSVLLGVWIWPGQRDQARYSGFDTK